MLQCPGRAKARKLVSKRYERFQAIAPSHHLHPPRDKERHLSILPRSEAQRSDFLLAKTRIENHCHNTSQSVRSEEIEKTVYCIQNDLVCQMVRDSRIGTEARRTYIEGAILVLDSCRLIGVICSHEMSILCVRVCLACHVIVHEFESVIHRVSVNRETGAIVEMQDCGGRADVDYVSFNGGL